jgi:hypothetical protein
MTHLNQILAIEKGARAKAHRAVTDAYHALQKEPRFAGITRSYRPKDDDGDRLPSESTLVQLNAETILGGLCTDLTRLFDVTMTKEAANQEARADVVVDGTVILSDIPVTGLLFLEKQLVDIRTFISKLPTLDPSEKWTHDAAAGAWATEVTETTRTKKVPQNHVKAPATDKHPAQVEMFYEDQVVGYWSTTKFSGALPADRLATLLARVDALADAVKFARERANSIDVTDVHVGKPVFDFLLAD